MNNSTDIGNHDMKQDNNSHSDCLAKEPLFYLLLESIRPTVITTELKTEYLRNIIDFFIVGEEREEYYKELRDFVNSIGDKEKLDNFTLPIELYNYLFSRDEESVINKLKEDLPLELGNFSYITLFKQMKKFYKYHVRDRKKRTLHIWSKIEPKKPNVKNDMSDNIQDYQYIMGKFYYNKYTKYMDRENTPAEGWTYHVCILYLVLIAGMYEILKDKITSINDFLVNLFKTINPIISGLVFKATYNVENYNAFHLIVEMLQLHTSNRYLSIEPYNDVPAVRFGYCTETCNINIKNPNKNIYMIVKGNKGTLIIQFDLVGLDAIKFITGKGEDGGCIAVDKTFFTLVTDEAILENTAYYLIDGILRNTEEFKYKRQEANKQARYKCTLNRWKIFVFNTPPDTVEKIEQDKIIYKDAFKILKPEDLLQLTKDVIDAFHLEREAIHKALISIKLASLSDSEVNEKISSYATAQQAQFRKIIKYVRNYQLPTQAEYLNHLLKAVNYKC